MAEIRQTPETPAIIAGDAPSPTPLGPSAADIAERTGDYTAFDRIVDRYVAEIRVGRRKRRVNEDTTPRCPECDHPLTGSVRPGSHGRPCMTVLEPVTT